MDSMTKYFATYLEHDDGSSLTESIFSPNLKASAAFSAKSARMAYLLGKASLLDATLIKGVIRTQMLEYGAVCEAILLDIVQAVGINNKPPNSRPLKDKTPKDAKIIDWAGDGLFTVIPSKPSVMQYKFDFIWLIDVAYELRVFDKNLRDRLHNLRKSRNLVHPVLPTFDRYSGNLASGYASRETVVALRDACLKFKRYHGLPTHKKITLTSGKPQEQVSLIKRDLPTCRKKGTDLFTCI